MKKRTVDRSICFETCAAIQAKSEYRPKKRRNLDLVGVTRYTMFLRSGCGYA
jgi:hypothetical protein